MIYAGGEGSLGVFPPSKGRNYVYDVDCHPRHIAGCFSTNRLKDSQIISSLSDPVYQEGKKAKKRYRR